MKAISTLNTIKYIIEPAQGIERAFFELHNFHQRTLVSYNKLNRETALSNTFLAVHMSLRVCNIVAKASYNMLAFWQGGKWLVKLIYFNECYVYIFNSSLANNLSAVKIGKGQCDMWFVWIYGMLRNLRLIAILTTIRDQTMHLVLVQRLIP